MKTRFISCLLLIMLLCVSLGAVAETPDNLMARIYLANNSGAILENHRSFQYTETGAYSHSYYADADVSVKDFSERKDYVRVRTDEFDYCLFESGAFSRFVNFETDPCDWSGLVDSMLYETVLSVEEGDGVLTVTTQPSEAVRQSILEDEYADVEDREQIQLREVYVVSADTLELQSLTYHDIMPDGSAVCNWEMRFAYDIDLPYAEEIETIRQHLAGAGERRTTRFVFDEGTADECVYEFGTPVGDNCVIQEEITKDNVVYQIDKDRSTLTNEAKDNDAVLYLDRVSED